MFADIWKKFLDLVREEVGSRVVDTWFCALSLYRWDQRENTVYLHVPNGFVQDWIEKKYSTLLQIHLGRLLNTHNLIIVFINITESAKSNDVQPKERIVKPVPAPSDVRVSGENREPVSVIPASRIKKGTALATKHSVSYVNPAYSFDTFRCGSE